MRGTNLTQRARREYLTKVGLNPDDLTSWGIKWRNLKNNAAQRGRRCGLSFEQYIDLALVAGISSPDSIGTSLDKYHMCRVGDEGDYVVGNCSFKPHSQNQLEKRINGGVDRWAEKMRKRREGSLNA